MYDYSHLLIHDQNDFFLIRQFSKAQDYKNVNLIPHLVTAYSNIRKDISSAALVAILFVDPPSSEQQDCVSKLEAKDCKILYELLALHLLLSTPTVKTSQYAPFTKGMTKKQRNLCLADITAELSVVKVDCDWCSIPGAGGRWIHLWTAIKGKHLKKLLAELRRVLLLASQQLFDDSQQLHRHDTLDTLPTRTESRDAEVVSVESEEKVECVDLDDDAVSLCDEGRVVHSKNNVHRLYGPRVRVASFNVENLRASYSIKHTATQKQTFSYDQLSFSLHNLPDKLIAASVLHDVNADVLVLLEVENQTVLDFFNRTYLSSLHYSYSVLINAVECNALNIALLSRYPIVAVRSHKDGIDQAILPRSCLEADVDVDGVPLTIYANHFKSKRGKNKNDRDVIIRRNQCKRVWKIVSKRWKSVNYAGNFIVMGDLNDTPNHQGSLAELLANPYLENVVSRLPRPHQWTHYFRNQGKSVDKYSQLDYMLVSSTLSALPTNAHTLPVIVRTGLCKRAAAYTGARYNSVGDVGPRASDHCPVLMDLQLFHPSLHPAIYPFSRPCPQPYRQYQPYDPKSFAAINPMMRHFSLPTLQMDRKRRAETQQPPKKRKLDAGVVIPVECISLLTDDEEDDLIDVVEPPKSLDGDTIVMLPAASPSQLNQTGDIDERVEYISLSSDDIASDSDNDDEDDDDKHEVIVISSDSESDDDSRPIILSYTCIDK